MGIDSDLDRPNPWGIVPAEQNMVGGLPGTAIWPSLPGQINPAVPNDGVSHAQVMSRVSLGF